MNKMTKKYKKDHYIEEIDSSDDEEDDEGYDEGYNEGYDEEYDEEYDGYDYYNSLGGSRKQRAFQQPIYLLKMHPTTNQIQRKFDVMGTTGNRYLVTIGENVSCSCPDNSQNNNTCKHIYFIMLRVMKIVGNVRKRYKEVRLTEMFKSIPHWIDNGVGFDKTVQKNFANQFNSVKVEQKFDDICPVCLEDITGGSKSVDYCKYNCGKSVHRTCYKVWSDVSKKDNCLFCMQPWIDDQCDNDNEKNDQVNYNQIHVNQVNDHNYYNRNNIVKDKMKIKIKNKNKNKIKNKIRNKATDYTYSELTNICKSRGLIFSGTKETLYNRLKTVGAL